MITQNQMPAPQELVECFDGEVVAAMFYYACEGQDLSNIALSHGFKTKFIWLQWDDADGSAYLKYERGEPCLEQWQPYMDDWALAGKWDTEDGPVALFIQPTDGETT